MESSDILLTDWKMWYQFSPNGSVDVIQSQIKS